MRTYIAILHKDIDSDFGVSFPDFPGCISSGSTLEEAKDMAREALPFHIEGMQSDGEFIPEPMSLDEALHVDLAEDAQAFFLVEVPIDDPIVRANITVPKGILERIDRYAKAHHLSRSAFLTQAAQFSMRTGHSVGP
jgi:predicted RNase H-like HicB family nuclease